MVALGLGGTGLCSPMDVYVERDFQWIENHRLSGRCGVSRTAANDRTWMSGLHRSEVRCRSVAAKAQKVLSAAARGETHASNGRTWTVRPGLARSMDCAAQWL